MPILLRMVSEKYCCGCRQSLHIHKFHKLHPIAMEQLSKEIYNVLEIWEPKDLKISTYSATDAEDVKEMVLRKSYKSCMHVYVPMCEPFLYSYELRMVVRVY